MNEYGASAECRWHEVLGDKPAPVPLSPPQYSHGLFWDWTRAFAVRGRQKRPEASCLVVRKGMGVVEVWLYSFLTLTLDGEQWSASRPGRFFPGNEKMYALNRRLSGRLCRSGLGHVLFSCYISVFVSVLLCVFVFVLACMRRDELWNSFMRTIVKVVSLEGTSHFFCSLYLHN